MSGVAPAHILRGMNYRHAYHAGNFADVFKHALLAICIEHLKGKEKPFFVLDTHAGIGLYDLMGEEAGKTGEWEQGIGRLLSHPAPPPELDPYLRIVRDLSADGDRRLYPGSPLIVRRLMRSQDRLSLCELHPVDAEALEANFARDRQVRVYGGVDGYGAIKAQLPPKERRGLVLVDPPFERRDEFAAVERGLAEGVRRWATGLYAVWYPIKDAIEVAAFHERLARMENFPKTHAVHLFVRDPRTAHGMNGCGFLFVNPPYGLMAVLDRIMPFLVDLLAQGDGAGWTGEWLVPER